EEQRPQPDHPPPLMAAARVEGRLLGRAARVDEGSEIRIHLVAVLLRERDGGVERIALEEIVLRVRCAELLGPLVARSAQVREVPEHLAVLDDPLAERLPVSNEGLVRELGPPAGPRILRVIIAHDDEAALHEASERAVKGLRVARLGGPGEIRPAPPPRIEAADLG